MGFSHNPTNTYFFPRLMDYYTAHGDNEAALDVVDRALEADGSNTLYLFAKSTVLFNMGRYDECIALSDSLISMNDSLPDPYYNAGTAYLNKALKLHPLRQKKQLRQVYQKARPYMERYRQLAPDQQRKWGPVLYRIYLNLNMGRQFDEIDQLLKTLR
jgi:tetratricopeptide (TPR) repeat protein